MFSEQTNHKMFEPYENGSFTDRSRSSSIRQPHIEETLLNIPRNYKNCSPPSQPTVWSCFPNGGLLSKTFLSIPFSENTRNVNGGLPHSRDNFPKAVAILLPSL
ncbi:hypothetical protein CDAR_511911 [Caerostris darwini]|uniref:Uncharacterized protein n=1 Tax=Caerostris darwini TaxID=1538125 RepID=A0AAV4P7K4_9ARAC|nr:hypothetical protein CDAR_511911 [Caerostris darwini]